jgi:hypothetical protein
LIAQSSLIEQATLNDCVDAADGPGRTAACGAISRDLASGQIAAARAIPTSVVSTPPGLILPRLRVTGHSGRCGRPVGHRDLGRPGWPSTPMPLRGRRAARRHPPYPRLRASLGARWSSQRLTLDWQARLIGSARITGDRRSIDRPATGRSYHDLGAALRLASGTLRLDVANVFDAAPPRRGYQTSQDRRRRALSQSWSHRPAGCHRHLLTFSSSRSRIAGLRRPASRLARRAAQTWPASDLQEEIVGILKGEAMISGITSRTRSSACTIPPARCGGRARGRWLAQPAAAQTAAPAATQDGAATDPDIVVTGSR